MSDWRHFRYIEPHEAVPVPGSEYRDPSGKSGAACANCGNGEAIGRPVTAAGDKLRTRADDLDGTP